MRENVVILFLSLKSKLELETIMYEGVPGCPPESTWYNGHFDTSLDIRSGRLPIRYPLWSWVGRVILVVTSFRSK